jgi:hypothetical protein
MQRNRSTIGFRDDIDDNLRIAETAFGAGKSPMDSVPEKMSPEASGSGAKEEVRETSLICSYSDVNATLRSDLPLESGKL